MSPDIRIGVSGWSYDHWRKGAFYPDDLPRSRELDYLSRHLNSAEINRSFYSLLTPSAYEQQREAVPPGFLFAVKGSRFITHSKKLKDVATPLANFFASGVLRLEETLGPIVWQLPEMSWDLERVRAFLELLPKDTEAASRLARRHDDRVTGRASMAVHSNRRLRHALEVRHEGFLVDQTIRICRRHNVALVFADSGDWPYTEELTSGFVYLRLHGSPETYASNYSKQALESWADKIKAWAGGGEPPDPRRITDRPPPRRKTRDVYLYFDNDGEAHAPANAGTLTSILGLETPGAWDEDDGS